MNSKTIKQFINLSKSVALLAKYLLKTIDEHKFYLLIKFITQRSQSSLVR